eukprot:5127668-Prymnesium_polylepis.1
MSSPGNLRVDSCRSALIDGGLEAWPTSGATPRAQRGHARARERVGGDAPGNCCYRPRAPIVNLFAGVCPRWVFLGVFSPIGQRRHHTPWR